MESIIAQQTSLGKEIEKIVLTYRRESPDKKTVQYLRDKLAAAKTLFDQFEKNHKECTSKYSAAVDHPYFKKEYYKSIKEMHNDFEKEVGTLVEYAQARKSIEKQDDSSSKSTANPTDTNTTDTDCMNRLVRRQKGVIAALKNTIKGVIIGGDQSRQYYEVKLETIKQYWNQIEENNNAIWELSENPSSCGYNEVEYFNLQDKIQELIIQINQELERSRSTTTNAVTDNTPANQSYMKLPKVILPKFDGDYLKWQQFFDLFTQMVHNQSMGNSQKMWYLKTNLSGEAEKLIRQLPVTDDNYTIAWEMLKNRYQNKRILVTTLLDKLMTQPSMTTESSSALKTLHDTTKECVLSLQNLGIPVKEYWDQIIIHILMKKLDKTTHALFEQSLSAPRDLQSLEKLLTFLETRFQALETLGQRPGSSKDPRKINKASVLVTNRTNRIECLICKKNHALYYCEVFLKLSPTERQEKARELNLCLNCLKKGHNFNKCLSRGCQRCNRKHNTLLHGQSSSSDNHRINKEKSNSQLTTPTNLAAQTKDLGTSYVFLGTALANIMDADGKPITCRILLDSGSQLNFITEKLRRKLRIEDNRVDLNISGIGDSKVKVNNRLNIMIESKFNNYTTHLEVYVIKEISAQQPQHYINTDNWGIPENLTLADPDFNRPQRIDILLGAEVYGEIMRNGQMKLKDNLPMLQNTTLGWIVLGKVSSTDYNTPFCGITNVELEKQLQRFWELEECPSTPTMSMIDKKCEEYFNSTTIRNESGRFVVNLPMLSNPNLLGDSKEIAYKRLLSIERRLHKEPELRKQYNAFLDEYLELGHMCEVNPNQLVKPYCFLPHHFVLKPSSSTTKLRVVFDASAKTSNNLSLNDLLLKGPKIQEDISSIITRFRFKKYVFTADISKMYRQIIMAEEDRNLQLIMWRQSHTETIKYYQLCTVTYGTKAAPYLAIKCLQRLAELERDRYPLGAATIRDFYVDDVLTGSNDLAEAIQIQEELQSLMKSGGFQLRKWCANHPKLIQKIPNKDREIQLNFSEMEDEHVKTLGLVWQPITDSFTIATNVKDYKCLTKRTILADMSQIFDPLGLVNPVVLMGKIFIQNLWKLKIDWDQEIPVELHSTWVQFRSDLHKLRDIKIPRYIFNNENISSIQLHAFADASERAYGTAIYVRSKDTSGTVTVKLLCAKSRVAPTKTTTLPRLELCAAKLAAQAVHHVTSTLNIKLEEVYYWSDSQIVLSWIKEDSALRKTFVANRIAAIQELTQNKEWRYVNTKENPADLVSRGLFPDQLKHSKLWFNGPEFLKTPKSKWPNQPVERVTLEEEDKSKKLAFTVTKDHDQHPLYTIDHGNSFRKLQRVLAYIGRSIKCFKQGKNRISMTQFLTVNELEEALKIIIKEVQSKSFHDEIKRMRLPGEIPKSSKLITLSPFLDADGILRVGGRLEAASISYNAKHPIILPSDHFVTKLLMNHLHKLHLHAGPQALQSIARQKYWILQGRNIARSVVTNCVRCTRIRPRLGNQRMGNLPRDRVQRARPFLNCGVDFCGPVYTHFKIRGKRPQKTYIAVFCCFATKAIHLEVVSDLSTEGFLGALKRFIARRGRCENIYCDNGRNFVGANNQLREIHTIMTENKSKEKIANMCADHQIQFHFIPPRTPHFGGLWEAAVKSTKYLLHRTVGPASLTYEELCTVITEIEAILNSRPLTQQSSDPNDLAALTPAHFLIGEPMISSVHTHGTNEHEKMALHTRWRLVNHLRNEFWLRWSTEYLSELQRRCKWTQNHPNIQQGTLVVLKDDNLPPLKWALGRIETPIHGPDQRVRVADVRTATGIIRRSIHTMAPLPIDLEDNSNEAVQHMEAGTPQEQSSNQTIESQNHKRDRSRIHKKRKNASGSTNPLKVFLLTTLILPLSSLALGPAPINVRQLNSKAGIFFENLGLSSIATNKWNLVVYYDLKGYWATTACIQHGIKQLERLSRTIKNNEYYVEIVYQYYHQLEEINTGNGLLGNQDTTLTKDRQKRSPLDIVGTVANKLFGVLDHEYSKKMRRTIERVKNNENHLYELIKNQTSVVETTINVIRKTEEERLNQAKQIEETLDMTYEKMRNMTAEAKQQKTIQVFNTLSILIASLLNECRFMQNAILDVITDTHHGRSNPLIISPNQIKTQLATIKENLPAGVELPTYHDQISVSLIYKLMKIHCQAEGTYIIFALHIPLVQATKFELYRLLSLPTLINNTFVSIAPTFEFLMADFYKSRFYLMKQIEFIQCMEIEDSHHLCEQRHPINNKAAKDNACEIDLFTHRTVPPTCALKAVEPSKIWIQLWTTNQWLFSLNKEYDLTFVCGNNIVHKTLDSNGIVTLESGCTMKDDETVLEATNNIKTQLIRESFQPNINITLDDVNTPIEDIIPLATYPKLRSHMKELDIINDEIKTIKLHQTKLQDLQPHDMHLFAVGYTALGIIIILGIYIIIQRDHGFGRDKPTAAPRHKVQLEDKDFEVGNFKEAQDVAT